MNGNGKEIRLNFKEKMSLENLMLRIALEKEKIERYTRLLEEATNKIETNKMLINVWMEDYEKKLSKKYDLTIKDVIIDIEKGTVEPAPKEVD